MKKILDVNLPDPDPEVIQDQGPEVTLDPVQEVIRTAVPAGPDRVPDPDQGEGQGLIHQIFQSGVDLHLSLRKGELQVQGKDPFHTDVNDSVGILHPLRALTVHTQDLVVHIQDPLAQDPARVLEVFLGHQEVEVDP